MSYTESLFHIDPYQKQFTAQIVEKRPQKEGFEVSLDRSCFYPEGGGQPSDIGTLGNARVMEVRKGDGGEVIHITDSDPGEGTVTGEIDWAHRFEYMQQHTGQHILSGALYRYGYNTLSVHQGSDFTTIEVDTPEIPAERLVAIEEEANGVIRANLPVRAFEVDEEELSHYELRRPPKVSGRIRLVEIEGWDIVACGGVHTATAGEVGIVHAVKQEKIRGNSRLYWKIGKRGYEDYRLKTLLTNKLMDQLSAQPEVIPERVEKLELDGKDQEYRRRQLEAAYSSLFLESRLQATRETIPTIVEELPAEAEATLMQQIVQDASQREAVAILLFLPDSTGGYRWSLTIKGCAEFPQKPLKEQLLPALEAKGGGRPPLWQGKAEHPEAPKIGEEIFKAIVTSAS